MHMGPIFMEICYSVVRGYIIFFSFTNFFCPSTGKFRIFFKCLNVKRYTLISKSYTSWLPTYLMAAAPSDSTFLDATHRITLEGSSVHPYHQLPYLTMMNTLTRTQSLT